MKSIAWPEFPAWARAKFTPSMAPTSSPVRTSAIARHVPAAITPPKGHWLSTFHNLRLGVPVDVQLEIRNRREVAVVRDCDRSPHALTRRRNGLFAVARAFIDAPFRDLEKAKLGMAMIARMKSNLRIDSAEDLGVAPEPVNERALRDLRVMLSGSRKPWRPITYRARRDQCVEF